MRFDLSDEKTRLLTSGLFIAVGAFAGAAGPSVTAPVAALAGTAAALAQGIFAGDLVGVLGRRMGRPDEVLRNHDLTRLVGQALGLVIGAASRDPDLPPPRQRRARELAARVPRRFERLAANKDLVPDPLEERRLGGLVTRDHPALSAVEWEALLAQLETDRPRSEDPGDADLRGALAAALEQRFSTAFRELLKKNFREDGRAFAGMVLLLLGDLQAGIHTLQAGQAALAARLEEQVSGGREAVAAALRAGEEDVLLALHAVPGEIVELLGLTQAILESLAALHARTEASVAQGARALELLEELEARVRPAEAAPSNLPPRNLRFTGREEVLAALQVALAAHDRAALHGPPGVGKSDTALEYAHSHRDEYTAVYWLRAADAETLLADLEEIARAAGLTAGGPADRDRAVSAARRHLEALSGWLLVLDNVDDWDLVRAHCPGDGGQVVFTSRAPAPEDLAAPVPITQLSVAQGAALFRHLCGDGRWSDLDEAAAAEISRLLDGLPLALDQAAALVREGIRPADYLALYQREGERLRARPGSRQDGVAVSYGLAIRRAAARHPAAADLVRLCARLAPERVPERLLADSAAILPDPLGAALADPLGRLDLFAALRGQALLRRDPIEGDLTFHRLTLTVARDEPPAASPAPRPSLLARLRSLGRPVEAPADRWGVVALAAVNHAFPAVEFANWPWCDRLLPHALAVLTAAPDSPPCARLCNQAAVYLRERGRYEEAERLLRRAVGIWERVRGRNHPDTAHGLHNLADVLHRRGARDEARRCLERALAVRERALGTGHPQVAATLNTLALLHSEEGRYQDAEGLFQRALAIRTRESGADHPETAAVLNNLGGLCWVTGRLADAAQLLQEALAIRARCLPADHPDRAASLENLALLRETEARRDEARSLLEQAAAIRERSLGPDHPETLRTRNLLTAVEEGLLPAGLEPGSLDLAPGAFQFSADSDLLLLADEDDGDFELSLLDEGELTLDGDDLALDLGGFLDLDEDDDAGEVVLLEDLDEDDELLVLEKEHP